ncbi:SusC/RagA family TonB-linked outer membrane protein [Bacteroides sp. AN502(2024)]|uniref:SusC/RagA family TonB-linked outer membrane protein n=1 Tax=Bacteroides sp. AN502(2024) TaxID=3160599 RepID=UPI003515191E
MERKSVYPSQPKRKVCPRSYLAQRTGFTLILIFLSVGIVFAQKTQITGTVTDESGFPLPGVSITTNDKSVNGTTTDGEGRFTLSVPSGKQVKTLTFSFVGMQTLVIPYKGGKIKVTLKEDTQQIEEVVVTGMYERKKEGFTGSANTMSGEEIRKMTSGNVLKAIELLDPGFRMDSRMMSGSNPSAVAGFSMRGQSSMGDYSTDETIFMRGDIDTRPNQPLFVLDGIIGVSVTKITDMDPEQIKSITLLKDAAAMVLYGSQASNGVVVVESKAPEAGKLRVTYNGNYKLEYPDLTDYDLLEAANKLELERRAGFYDEDSYSLEDITNRNNTYRKKLLEVLRGVNTYWLSQPLQTAFAHRHGINLEGGDESLRYKLYAGINQAPGIMKKTGVYGKSASLDIRYRYKGLLISNILYVDYSKSDRTSPYGSFKEYAQLNPYYRIHDENGQIAQYLERAIHTNDNTGRSSGANVGNPMYNTLYNTFDRNVAFEVRDAFRAEYTPIPNLRLAMDLTLSKTTSDTDVFKSANHNDFISVYNISEKGSYVWNNSSNLDYDLSFTASYNKVFNNKQLLSAYLRYNVNEKKFHNAGAYATGFPNDNMDEIFLGAKAKKNSGSESTSRAFGGVATISYTYDQRYAADLNGRLDASSEFGKNNRYAPFWSAGVRWNADKEKFIRKLGLFDELVFRATYGITGTQGISTYEALQMYTYANSMRIYDSSDVVGTMLLGMGNPDLKWQTTDAYNIGVDFNMFNRILSGRFEYYYKLTKNTILDYSLAPSTGFSTIKDNLGNITNSGYEFSLRIMPYNNLQRQLNFNVVINGSHNVNKIKKISNALRIRNQELLKPDSNNPNKLSRPMPRYEEGYSQSIIWAIRSLGIDPITGREIYLTRNGERTSEWNAVDVVPVGDMEPKLAGTLSANLNWKGLSISLAARYQFGGQVYNKTLVDKIENANLHYNVDKRAFTDRWNENEIGKPVKFKSVSSKNNGSQTFASTRFLMKDNQLIMNTVNIQYRFERRYCPFIKRLGLSNASVGLYLEDLFHFTTVKVERGIEYPMSRQASLSLNLTF